MIAENVQFTIVPTCRTEEPNRSVLRFEVTKY